MARWLDSSQARKLLEASKAAHTVALHLIGWGTITGSLRQLREIHPASNAGDQAVLSVLTELEELGLVELAEDRGRYTVQWRSPEADLPLPPYPPPSLSKDPPGPPPSGSYGPSGQGVGVSPVRGDQAEAALQGTGQGGPQEGTNKPPQLGLPGLVKDKPTPRKRKLTKGQAQWARTDKLVRLWVSRTGRPESDVKVTPYRIKLVRDRMAEGYTWEELAMAVAGIAYSPWHRDHGKDLFELAVGEGQVDKAKGLWWSHAPVEVVRDYQERTGHTPPAREADLQAADREDQVEEADRERWTRTSREAAKLQDTRRRQEEAQAAESARWAGVFTDDDQGDKDQEAAEC